MVLASPVAANSIQRALYAAAYHGTCGPHAPDIAAHSCTQAQYMDEFAAGFGGIGVLIVDLAAFVGVALAIGTAWLVRAARRRAPPRNDMPQA
jgi:hypothetical protein